MYDWCVCRICPLGCISIIPVGEYLGYMPTRWRSLRLFDRTDVPARQSALYLYMGDPLGDPHIASDDMRPGSLYEGAKASRYRGWDVYANMRVACERYQPDEAADEVSTKKKYIYTYIYRHEQPLNI